MFGVIIFYFPMCGFFAQVWFLVMLHGVLSFNLMCYTNMEFYFSGRASLIFMRMLLQLFAYRST